MGGGTGGLVVSLCLSTPSTVFKSSDWFCYDLPYFLWQGRDRGWTHLNQW